MNQQLLALGIQGISAAIEAIKAHRAQADPTLPPLTDDEAIAICRAALDSTEAKDDLWLSQHPNG